MRVFISNSGTSGPKRAVALQCLKSAGVVRTAYEVPEANVVDTTMPEERTIGDKNMCSSTVFHDSEKTLDIRVYSVIKIDRIEMEILVPYPEGTLLVLMTPSMLIQSYDLSKYKAGDEITFDLGQGQTLPESPKDGDIIQYKNGVPAIYRDGGWHPLIINFVGADVDFHLQAAIVNNVNGTGFSTIKIVTSPEQVTIVE